MNVIPNLGDIEILTPDGFQPFAALGEFESTGLIVSFEDGSSMNVSEDHLFMLGDKKILAKELSVGDSVEAVDGYKVVSSIETAEATKYFGPLAVLGEKYIANGVVNHNCAFVGSSTTLVDPAALDKMKPQDPVAFKYNYALSIFEEPDPEGLYVMGVDSANGSGKDYSVVQVLRIFSRDHFEQVAVYSDNKVPPGKFSCIIQFISQYYNNASIIIENNEVGRIVADECWYTLGLETIINTDQHGIGTRATKSSKLDGCQGLKKAIEEEVLIVKDAETIHQLARFEEVAPNVFKGPRNSHDDHVMALVWAVYCTAQPEIDLDHVMVKKVKEDYIPPQTFFFDDTDDFWGG